MRPSLMHEWSMQAAGAARAARRPRAHVDQAIAQSSNLLAGTCAGGGEVKRESANTQRNATRRSCFRGSRGTWASRGSDPCKGHESATHGMLGKGCNQGQIASCRPLLDHPPRRVSEAALLIRSWARHVVRIAAATQGQPPSDNYPCEPCKLAAPACVRKGW